MTVALSVILTLLVALGGALWLGPVEAGTREWSLLALATATCILGLGSGLWRRHSAGPAKPFARIDFAQVFKELQQPICIRDAAQRVLFANAAFTTLYRSAPKRLVGVGGPTSKSRRLREEDLLTASIGGSNDQWLATINGAERRFAIRQQALHQSTWQGPPLQLITAQDVSQEHRLQRQLQFSQRLETVSTLSSGLAHDFNNLLTPILGYAELLLQRAPDSPHQTELQAIADAACKARRVTEQMLAFTDRRPAATRLERVELPDAIAEVERFLQATVAPAITIRLDQRQPAAILIDSGELNQVLLNLTTNAIQSIGDQAGTLTLMVDVLPPGSDQSPASLRAGACARVSIIDNGPGISEALQQLIFEPFFTTKDIEQGSGLGLSVARHIIQQNGGELSCTSTPGQGACFDLFFAALPATAAEGASALPLELLLIEERPPVLQHLSDVLLAFGYRVSGFKSPIAGLAALRREPGRYSLLIASSSLTDLSVAELRAQVQDTVAGLPVLFIEEEGLPLQRTINPMTASITAAPSTQISVDSLQQAINRALDERKTA